MIEPFFFGRNRLYGYWHRAQEGAVRGRTVVLCYPVGHEYIRSHRAFYQLAVRLARAGNNVFRFDYTGCGDSGGDYEEGGIHQWTDDISRAIQEARKRSGAHEVCLVGLRMGATLALRAACERDDVQSLVLWEPVCDGQKYLEELAGSEAEFRSHLVRRKRKGAGTGEISNEVIGYPLTGELIKQTKEIDFCSFELGLKTEVLVIVNAQPASDVNDMKALAGNNANSELRVIVEPKLWMVDLYKRIIPNETLQVIVTWINMLKT